MHRMRVSQRAFVLQELLVLLLVFVAILAVLAVIASRTRSLASLGESMANLRQMHHATATFADDNAQKFATFWWTKGNAPSSYPDLQHPGTDLDAAACQAVDIIRRRANFPTMPRITGWVPHLFYSHLVLSDYLGTQLPHRWVIAPEDPKRLTFALDRSQWQSAGVNARWAFSSSYEVPVAFWSSPDSGTSAISQGSAYNSFLVPNGAQFGNRRLDEVVYPAQKVMYHDRHQRHFGPRQGYFMHEESRVPVATVDGAVTVRRGAHGNPGWQPNAPTNPSASFTLYNPAPSGQFAWDPPPINPTGDQVPCRYRFTRKALFGRDVDGPEVSGAP